MRVIFDGLAKIELDDGKEYYEMEVIGLGKRFKQEVKRAINIIKKCLKLVLQKVKTLEGIFFISFLTKCYTPLKKTIFMLSLLHTYTVNQCIGLIELENKQIKGKIASLLLAMTMGHSFRGKGIILILFFPISFSLVLFYYHS